MSTNRIGTDSAKLSKYIKNLGIPHKETFGSFIFNCPLCHGKEKVYIRKSDGKFMCFRCAGSSGFKGNAEYAIIELTDIPLSTVKLALYGNTQEQASFLDLKVRDFFEGNEEDDLGEAEEKLPKLTWPYHCIPISHNGSKNGQDYLSGRGVPLDIASMYHIRYSPQNRAVVFPVYDNNDLVGWQYRTIDKTRFLIDDTLIESAKAWSSPNLPRGKVFMFSDRLKNSNHAVICEGPIDAIMCHKIGGNVCAMGKSISTAHVATILRSGIKKVYAGLDPDAFSELNPLFEKLGDDIDVRYVKLPYKGNEKVDLGSLSMDEAYQYVINAPKMLPNRLYVWMAPKFK